MSYNWQQPDWPDFRYNLRGFEDTLLTFAEESGRISGMMQAMPEAAGIEAALDIMVSEAMKTSEIEGEYLSRQDVVSSIRNNLGLNKVQDKIKDKKSQGAGELMVAVRNTFAAQLTEETLFAWHKILMGPDTGINVGCWRTGSDAMQIVSGAIGKENIHFEAPPSTAVPGEMQRFIAWFNNSGPGGPTEIKKAPVRAAIAHLYFESIHPFEDGNGRIGRAIAEKALSQTLGRPALLSLSQTIEADKKSYYSALANASHTNEITQWIIYFVQIVFEAQRSANRLIDFTLKKTKFYDLFKNNLNERQEKVIRKMLDAGPNGFEGGMTAKKYISITRTSKASATRDLQMLAELGILAIEGEGRSTHYRLSI